MPAGLEPAFEHDPLPEAGTGCVFRVANGLGAGFLEQVYAQALLPELRKAGLEAQQHVVASVHCDGQKVGDHIGDIVVEGRLPLELKACQAQEDVHLAQGLNDLKVTGIPTCLLTHFGTPKPQIRRVSR